MEIIVIALIVANIALWIRIRMVEDDAKRDYGFFSWWMNSIESRKVDREVYEDVQEDE